MKITARYAAAALALSTLLPAAPAAAHGALDSPVSRATACAAGGKFAQSPACRAAVAAMGGGAIAWDNVRVPNIAGRDRQLIPDGKLCSGGLAAFKGLDLGRSDWPTTTVTSGAAFTFRYRVSIPHEGSFRLYVTHDGYDPTVPLRWSDLVATPFLSATNPTARDGAYALSGRLPAGRTGRQLLLTIWQTSSTPDTYYSCSDVVFAGAAAASPAAVKATSAAPVTPAAASPSATPAPAVDAPAPADAAPAIRRTNGSTSMGTIGRAALAALGFAVFGVVLLLIMRRRARR